MFPTNDSTLSRERAQSTNDFWPQKMRHSVDTLRWPGLDTLRGVAAVLVVLLHAGIPYMSTPLPHLPWPAIDAHPSTFVDGLTWWLECFLMPLFFVLAGFLAAGVLVVRGTHGFLNNRTKRLLWPQFAAGLVILPPCIYIWALGWAADGLYVPHSLLVTDLPFELKTDFFGSSHLWYLQNLYIYSVILCGGAWLWEGLRERMVVGRLRETHFVRWGERVLHSSGMPLIPAICSALILFWDPRIVLGFYQTFLPVLSKLAYYALYFFTGVLLYRNRRSIPVRSYGILLIAIAAAIFAFLAPLIHEHLANVFTGPRLALLAGGLAMFAWLMTIGVFGIFLRSSHGGNAVTQYLAEASYWVYLIHLPFVVLAQIAVARLPVETPVKFLMSGAIALCLSLTTYQVFVRSTWVGEFLNGNSRRPKTREPVPRLGERRDQFTLGKPHDRHPSNSAPAIAKLST